MPPEEEANVRRIFNLARQDVAGFEHYAGQIAQSVRGNPAMLEDILDGLFEIAKSRRRAASRRKRASWNGWRRFSASRPTNFAASAPVHFAPELTDPYVILGLSYVADEDEIRQTYLRLVRENHPDSLIARGVPEEFIKLATDKLAAINTAYEKILAERGLQVMPRSSGRRPIMTSAAARLWTCWCCITPA